jgi:site-specific DNA recombinase
VVWREVVKLLESPRLIDEEPERRLATARNVGPGKRRRKEILQGNLLRVQSSMERLITACQEDLSSLDGLRRRMPDVGEREQAIPTELNAIERNELADPAAYFWTRADRDGLSCRVARNSKDFGCFGTSAYCTALGEKIIVADDAIIIRHSIPAPSSSLAGGQPTSSRQGQPFSGGSCLLRSGSSCRTSRRRLPQTMRRCCRFADQRQQRMTILLLPCK